MNIRSAQERRKSACEGPVFYMIAEFTKLIFSPPPHLTMTILSATMQMLPQIFLLRSHSSRNFWLYSGLSSHIFSLITKKKIPTQVFSTFHTHTVGCLELRVGSCSYTTVDSTMEIVRRLLCDNRCF